MNEKIFNKLLIKSQIESFLCWFWCTKNISIELKNNLDNYIKFKINNVKTRISK